MSLGSLILQATAYHAMCLKRVGRDQVLWAGLLGLLQLFLPSWCRGTSGKGAVGTPPSSKNRRCSYCTAEKG